MPCDIEWDNKSNKNEIAVIPMPGTNSFKLSPFLDNYSYSLQDLALQKLQ